MADPDNSAARLDEMRDVAGVRLSLDDFGTGYSSLTYVRMFRANTIKIDRSFVAGLPDNPESQAVVRTIISLARELGATVVAEGPETVDQVRFLREHGCAIGAGLLLQSACHRDRVRGAADERAVRTAGSPSGGRRKQEAALRLRRLRQRSWTAEARTASPRATVAPVRPPIRGSRRRNPAAVSQPLA